jgi:hypothetical protein
MGRYTNGNGCIDEINRLDAYSDDFEKAITIFNSRKITITSPNDHGSFFLKDLDTIQKIGEAFCGGLRKLINYEGEEPLFANKNIEKDRRGQDDPIYNKDQGHWERMDLLNADISESQYYLECFESHIKTAPHIYAVCKEDCESILIDKITNISKIKKIIENHLVNSLSNAKKEFAELELKHGKIE